VWTSGKLVNIWNWTHKSRDVKDVCVFPRFKGYFRNVKVPSSPYKRGRMGTCKEVHNFWGEYKLSKIPCLSWIRELHIFLRFSRVRGDFPIFGPLNIGAYSGFSRRTAHDATTKEIQEDSLSFVNSWIAHLPSFLSCSGRLSDFRTP
jgi:hypothetical protein